ncbi:MAG TPA: energy-coupling factor ABC transporter permease [Candidatus Bathyarchaeia archaeon]
MHIPDGILNPYTCILMFVLAFSFLMWGWRGMKRTLPRSFIMLAAVVAAIILIIQMFEFPVAGGGSTWHIMGSTIVTMILGPYGATISLTVVLIIQALAFGDGGLTSFGANVFNMAVIGALSFFVVKALVKGKTSKKRLTVSVFAASWLSSILTAFAVGIQIGISPLVGDLGGIAVTVPTMLFWYVPTGLIEAIISSSLVVSLSRIIPEKLCGLTMLKDPIELGF